MAVCAARRLDRPLRLEMQAAEVIDPRESGDDVGSVRALTQWYTTRLEQFIRRAPEQYWWLHRRWKDNRPPRKKAA